jgi:MoaA/NifB/PqqE/SkfB family radical SAM enzyme
MTMLQANAPYPIKLTVALTDRCNLKCFICTREEFEGEIGSKGSNLVLENLQKMEPALREAEIIQLTGFGETFLHPQLGEALDYIYAINPRENLVYFISNGTLLSRAWGEKLDNRLNYLAISLNAARPETYKLDMHPYLYRYTRDSAPKAYRGKRFAEDKKRERPCPFEQTVGRIGDFMSALGEQSGRRVALHYVVHRDNIDEMPEFVRLAHGLGITQVHFTHYMMNRVENMEFSIFFEKDRYNAAINDAVLLGDELGVSVMGRRFFAEEDRTFIAERDCDWPINQAMVFTRGETSPCCYIGEVDLGNAFATNFDDVWNGNPFPRPWRSMNCVSSWVMACCR